MSGLMPPVDDEVGQRLRGFADSIQRQLGEAAIVRRVSRQDVAITGVDVEPRSPDACPVSWVELSASELVLQVSHGGRWELDRTVEEVGFIERVVAVVIVGEVI